MQELDKSVSLVTAGNGVEALEMLRADKTFIPDCIFLDLNMPRMNGKECLPEIRKAPLVERRSHLYLYYLFRRKRPARCQKAWRDRFYGEGIQPRSFEKIAKRLVSPAQDLTYQDKSR